MIKSYKYTPEIHLVFRTMRDVHLYALLMGRKERKTKKKVKIIVPQLSTRTKHNQPARINFMLPLGESMVARRIKLAYMRLLEEGEEAALIPKEVADEPPEEDSPEEDPFARASSDDDDAGLSDDGFRLRTTFEGGCWVESMRLVTPMRDLPWSKICAIEKKEEKKSIRSIKNFFCRRGLDKGEIHVRLTVYTPLSNVSPTTSKLKSPLD